MVLAKEEEGSAMEGVVDSLVDIELAGAAADKPSKEKLGLVDFAVNLLNIMVLEG